jgi:preprotein translocase subunit SecF
MVDLFRERKWDLVGNRWLWFLIMSLTIAISIGALIYRGQTKGSVLNWGIDFTGGGLITLKMDKPIPASEEIKATEEIRALLEKTGIRVQVQLTSNTVGQPRDQIVVRTELPKTAQQEGAVARTTVLEQQAAQIEEALRARFAGIKAYEKIQVEAVVSKELTTNAAWAVLLGCMAIIFWIFIRYDIASGRMPKYALCAIFALFHDLILLAGAFAVVWWIVDSPFVAAFLTILGYSVHDTIIIFDRIRENIKLRKRPTFAETVNLSLLETMARSVNTVLTVELVLVCLYVFGGVTLRGFAGALIIGITSGAWSSIFIASQLLVSWKKREEKPRLVAAMAGKGTRPAVPSARAGKAPMPTPAKNSGAVSESISTASADTSAAASSGAAQTDRGKKLRGKKRHRRF